MFIRESAPLCLAFDSCWGRVYIGWAWIAATITMQKTVAGVKTGRFRSRATTGRTSGKPKPQTRRRSL
jgi:hypothetical protein